MNTSFNNNIADMTLFITDCYTFAEMVRGLKVGDGGVHSVIKAMGKKNSLSPYQKLKIIVSRKFDGTTLFKDNYKVDPGNIKMRSGLQFQLFIRYVYVNNDMTKEEFKDIFPDVTEDKITRWILNYLHNKTNKFKV